MVMLFDVSAFRFHTPASTQFLSDLFAQSQIVFIYFVFIL